MPRFGKPDQTGRSSGRHGGRVGNLHRPPKGEPFVWLTRELIASPAWRAQSINCRRFVDFLLVEHMHHAGTMNGDLKAPYNQLEASGLTREHIRGAIEEAIGLGLVCRLKHHYRKASDYALTWLPIGDQPSTNDWKRTTEATVHRLKRDRAEHHRATRAMGLEHVNGIGSAGAETRTQLVRKPAPNSADPKTAAEIKDDEPFDSAVDRSGAESRTPFYISPGERQEIPCQRTYAIDEVDLLEIPDFLRRPRKQARSGASE